MCEGQSAGDLELSGRWNTWTMVGGKEATEKDPVHRPSLGLLAGSLT